MNNIVLSICIPTANRKKELLKQVETLLKQAESSNLLKKIQIVIGDNTDDLNELVNFEIFSHDSVKYIKNHTNIGYAKNVNNVLLNADGLFSWLLSDDDLLEKHALEKIYNSVLNNLDSAYITFISGGLSKGKIFNKNMYFEERPNHFTTNGFLFLEKFWRSIIFISINIFNTKILKKHMEENNFLEKINEVYQNSLLGITLVATYGNVTFIDELLLCDNYSNKIYKPESINDVSVDKYKKLYNQLRSYGVPVILLKQMNRELIRNTLNYGLVSVVYHIEYSSVPIYKSTYWGIFSDRTSSFILKITSLVIIILLTLPRCISRPIVTMILFSIKGQSYSEALNKWKRYLCELNQKIPSSY
jgi:glycosyltransferase involved in cell wall biosynthesis